MKAIGGQPTKEMRERAESWCDEHQLPRDLAPGLAEIFSLWAAEYERRGERTAAPVEAAAELREMEPIAEQLVKQLEAIPALAARLRAVLA